MSSLSTFAPQTPEFIALVRFHPIIRLRMVRSGDSTTYNLEVLSRIKDMGPRRFLHVCINEGRLGEFDGSPPVANYLISDREATSEERVASLLEEWDRRARQSPTAGWAEWLSPKGFVGSTSLPHGPRLLPEHHPAWLFMLGIAKERFERHERDLEQCVHIEPEENSRMYQDFKLVRTAFDAFVLKALSAAMVQLFEE